MPLSGGQTFAGYRILRMLGSGGMGEVYLAQHPRLPRTDALKVLGTDVSASADYRARFAREADLASTLWHPHIVGVHDRGDDDGQLWISMDYVDGQDAAHLLTGKFHGGMPAHLVSKIVTAVASALDYAHDRGLLHRDVKPANIMITDDEQRILLTDFGIARSVADTNSLTATGFTMGTIAYSAPEQLTGDELDGRADQYALAATAYHLLSGSQLFPNSNPAVVIGRHLNTAPPALAKTRPELAALDSVLATALAKDPKDRFPRCGDFASALTLARIDTKAAVPTKLSPAGAARPAVTRAVTSPHAAQPVVDESVFIPSQVEQIDGFWSRRRAIVALCAALAGIAAVAYAVHGPWQQDLGTSKSVATSPPAPTLTFESMRDFVNTYYAQLPGKPFDAWTKLDDHCQQQTGLNQFVDFWTTIRSVTLVSVSPRDDSSVVARLQYVRKDGESDSEDRWLKMALVSGQALLHESERIGAVNDSTTTAVPSTTTSSPPTTTPPYQPESEVDQFLRHAHALGIHHQQGDGALVAAGNRMCDSVRTGVPIPSVVLGNTAVMMRSGVNEKDADAFVWYALNDLCGSDLFARLPPGGYCVEGGTYNGTTQQCMSDHPTQSPAGATVTLPTSSTAVPPATRGDCTAGDECHGR